MDSARGNSKKIIQRVDDESSEKIIFITKKRENDYIITKVTEQEKIQREHVTEFKKPSTRKNIFQKEAAKPEMPPTTLRTPKYENVKPESGPEAYMEMNTVNNPIYTEIDNNVYAEPDVNSKAQAEESAEDGAKVDTINCKMCDIM